MMPRAARMRAAVGPAGDRPLALPGGYREVHHAHGAQRLLRVAFAEVAVPDWVKQAGGTWNPERRVWQLRYDRVVALGLNRRIVDEPASNSGCPRSSGENLHADARAASR